MPELASEPFRPELPGDLLLRIANDFQDWGIRSVPTHEYWPELWKEYEEIVNHLNGLKSQVVIAQVVDRTSATALEGRFLDASNLIDAKISRIGQLKESALLCMSNEMAANQSTTA